jgi:hypothetical protein
LLSQLLVLGSQLGHPQRADSTRLPGLGVTELQTAAVNIDRGAQLGDVRVHSAYISQSSLCRSRALARVYLDS